MRGSTAVDGACACGGLIEAFYGGEMTKAQAADLLEELIDAFSFLQRENEDVDIDPADDPVSVFYQERWSETIDAVNQALMALRNE